MARRKPLLTVTIAPRASDELEQIWRYNALHRGVKQADSYEAFLKGHLFALNFNDGSGKVIETTPALRYITINRHSRSDGHVAVYRVDAEAKNVRVLHVFHTKQDWQNKL